MALRLRRYGITRVRPLHGGLYGWQERNYPVERLDPGAGAAQAGGPAGAVAVNV